MKTEQLREIAEIMSEFSINKVKIQEDNVLIQLESDGKQEILSPLNVKKIETSETSETFDDKSLFTVTSPIVGVYYSAPSADLEPFVSVGDKIIKGDTLCIIEAMKMMNEITSDVDGVIEEVCINNKEIVEFGSPLFKIKIK